MVSPLVYALPICNVFLPFCNMKRGPQTRGEGCFRTLFYFILLLLILLCDNACCLESNSPHRTIVARNFSNLSIQEINPKHRTKSRPTRVNNKYPEGLVKNKEPFFLRNDVSSYSSSQNTSKYSFNFSSSPNRAGPLNTLKPSLNHKPIATFSFENHKMENVISKLKFKTNSSFEKESSVTVRRKELQELNLDNKFPRKTIPDIFLKKRRMQVTDTSYSIPDHLLHFDKDNLTEIQALQIMEFIKGFHENHTNYEVMEVLETFNHVYGNANESLFQVLDSSATYTSENNDTLPELPFVPGTNNAEACEGGKLACEYNESTLLVIKELRETTFCFVVESENDWYEGVLEQRIKIVIMCNETTQISSIEQITNSTFKHLISEIDVNNQKHLESLKFGEFSAFKNLAILSITKTVLNHIEENVFGELKNLIILDLRHNLIPNLSWRIFLPAIHNRDDSESIVFSPESDMPVIFTSWPNKFLILLDGNPLLKKDCGTEWAFERLERYSKDSWSSASESTDPETPNESPNKTVSGVEWNFQEIMIGGAESEARSKNVDIDANKTFECLSSKYSDENKCYLCTPQLSIVAKTSNVLKIECKVGGNPAPKLQWVVANERLLQEENVTMDGKVVSSIISINASLLAAEDPLANEGVFGSSKSSSKSSSEELISTKSFASCLAFNDRGYEIRSLCDLETLSLLKLKSDAETSNVKVEVKISSLLFHLDPRAWKWSYSPCSQTVAIESSLTFTLDKKATGSTVSGFLHYTKSGKILPGWYKLEVETPCGRVENETQYFENQPYLDSLKECPLNHPFQPLVVSVATSKMNIGTTSTFPSYISSSSTDVVKVWLNISEGNDSLPNITTSPPLDKENVPLSLLSAILIGIFSALIVMVWISAIIVMRHWRGNRIFFSQHTSNYESPFKIVFLEKESDSKKDSSAEFSRHEMHLLNPDRLVENPEYLSGSESEELENWNQPQVISAEKLKFVTELGEGAFGRVYLGLMEDPDGKTVKVAVKTLKSLGPESHQDVKREVEMLSNLQHEKIIKFHGVCHDPEAMFMVFEYMEHGDLNHYLRLHNEEYCIASNECGAGAGGEPLTVMDCLQIALQIASGMTYLASQHYVHRDLATRNCLVSGNLTVKIGDFGMSRDVYTSDYYQIGGRALLPIRWMPPESILYRRFTIESDIWSFGVVLWEIFTGGKQPWYGYTNQEVITQITAGKMLFCPDKCPPDMYRLMTACWNKQPQDRTSMECLNRNIRALTTLQPNLVD